MRFIKSCDVYACPRKRSFETNGSPYLNAGELWSVLVVRITVQPEMLRERVKQEYSSTDFPRTKPSECCGSTLSTERIFVLMLQQ